jgi:hypothetical protein
MLKLCKSLVKGLSLWIEMGMNRGEVLTLRYVLLFSIFMLHKVFHLKCTTFEDCTVIKLWLNTQLTLFGNESTASDFVMTSILYLNAKKKS